jgi:hypothetical protein
VVAGDVVVLVAAVVVVMVVLVRSRCEVADEAPGSGVHRIGPLIWGIVATTGIVAG